MAPQSPNTTVTWSWIDALVVLIAAFAIYVVGAIILGAVVYAIDPRHTPFWYAPASYLFLSLGTYAMVSFWLFRVRKASWRSIGFRAERWGRIFGAYIGSLIALYIGQAVIVAIVNSLHTSYRIKGNAKELLPHGQGHINIGQFVTLVLLAAVVAPLTEETLFRGVLYQAIRGDASSPLGKVPAIAFAAIFSGLLFGGFHLLGGTSELNTLPILVYFGLVLALAFQRADSIAGSLPVHATVNLFAVIVLFVQHH